MNSQTEKLKLSNICKGKCAFGVAVYDLALFVDLRKHRVCDTNDKCITSDCSRSLHKARHSSDCNRWNGRMVGSKSILYSIPIPSELFTISFVNNVCFIIIFILLWGSAVKCEHIEQSTCLQLVNTSGGFISPGTVSTALHWELPSIEEKWKSPGQERGYAAHITWQFGMLCCYPLVSGDI